MSSKYAIFCVLVIAGLLGSGCAEPGWLNFVWPLQGSISVTFVNETPFRVVTYWGGYNPLAPEGLTVRKLVLEAGQTDFATIVCYRRFDVAGLALRRAVELGRPEGVEPEDINERVGFSDLPADDPDPEVPTAGSAEAISRWLAVDYFCDEPFEIHFKQVGTTDQFFVEMVRLEQ